MQTSEAASDQPQHVQVQTQLTWPPCLLSMGTRSCVFKNHSSSVIKNMMYRNLQPT